MTTATPIPCPILIDNEWSVPSTAETAPVHNPSTGEVIARTPVCGSDVVDSAVRSARTALAGWKNTPPVDRARVLFRYKMLLEDSFEELAESITREHGKTLTESRGDVRRGIEVVEYSCGAPELLKGGRDDQHMALKACEAIVRQVQPGQEIFTDYGPWFPYARHDMSRRVLFQNEDETTAALPHAQKEHKTRLLSTE